MIDLPNTTTDPGLTPDLCPDCGVPSYGDGCPDLTSAGEKDEEGPAGRADASDETARPTQGDATAAMDALIETIGLTGLEDVLDPAVAYINDRHALYGEPPLWGRNTAIAASAMALAIRAYAKATASVEHVDAWDVSRMEHETDVLRDRIRALEKDRDDESALVSDARHERDTAREEASELRRVLRSETGRLQALADRRWLAYQSARGRAQAYGEGILRHVEERNWALGWLKAAEGRAAELDIENKKLRATVEAVSCAGSLDEVGEALEQTTTAPTRTHHTE